jgi:hypothetical protein
MKSRLIFSVADLVNRQHRAGLANRHKRRGRGLVTATIDEPRVLDRPPDVETGLAPPTHANHHWDDRRRASARLDPAKCLPDNYQKPCREWRERRPKWAIPISNRR